MIATSRPERRRPTSATTRTSSCSTRTSSPRRTTSCSTSPSRSSRTGACAARWSRRSTGRTSIDAIYGGYPRAGQRTVLTGPGRLPRGHRAARVRPRGRQQRRSRRGRPTTGRSRSSYSTTPTGDEPRRSPTTCSRRGATIGVDVTQDTRSSSPVLITNALLGAPDVLRLRLAQPRRLYRRHAVLTGGTASRRCLRRRAADGALSLNFGRLNDPVINDLLDQARVARPTRGEQGARPGRSTASSPGVLDPPVSWTMWGIHHASRTVAERRPRRRLPGRCGFMARRRRVPRPGLARLGRSSQPDEARRARHALRRATTAPVRPRLRHRHVHRHGGDRASGSDRPRPRPRGRGASARSRSQQVDEDYPYLDEPLLVQYVLLAEGHPHRRLGLLRTSPASRSSTCSSSACRRTVFIVLWAIVIGLLIAVPLGVYSAYRRDALFDKSAQLQLVRRDLDAAIWSSPWLLLFLVVSRFELLPQRRALEVRRAVGQPGRALQELLHPGADARASASARSGAACCAPT